MEKSLDVLGRTISGEPYSQHIMQKTKEEKRRMKTESCKVYVVGRRLVFDQRMSCLLITYVKLMLAFL